MKEENIILISCLVTVIAFLVIIYFDMNKPIQPITLRYEDLVSEEEENNETY